MIKCPRCESEKLVENQKFCPICGLKLDTSKEGAIASLKELHDNPLLRPRERQAIEYAITKLERTAQEVSVQEQFSEYEKMRKKFLVLMILSLVGLFCGVISVVLRLLY